MGEQGGPGAVVRLRPLWNVCPLVWPNRMSLLLCYINPVDSHKTLYIAASCGRPAHTVPLPMYIQLLVWSVIVWLFNKNIVTVDRRTCA